MVQETRKPRLEPRDEWGRTPRKLVAPYQCRKTLPFHNLGGSVDALLEVNPLTRQQWIRAQSRCDRYRCAFPDGHEHPATRTGRVPRAVEGAGTVYTPEPVIVRSMSPHALKR